MGVDCGAMSGTSVFTFPSLLQLKENPTMNKNKESKQSRRILKKNDVRVEKVIGAVVTCDSTQCANRIRLFLA